MYSLEEISSYFWVVSLTADRWTDLESLFGKRGACGGGWFMWWELTRSQFKEQKGEKNKKAFRDRVLSGEIPGLLGYFLEEPVGWCAVEP